MKKKLVKIGDSKGVILPKSILNMMDINTDNDKIEITFDGKNITIKKAS
jgi:antitoxin component of MazEF toxin-antitoxin module